ncbi:MAG TPA: class II aldolase [Alphaproteobacteria bacterium]|nr:class II aldolase [Alphaproteobacteria bacterium]
MVSKLNLHSEISKLSAKLGSDLNLIQGAGGNISWKEDNGIMWIKASGTWLAQAMEKNIFVPLKIDILKQQLSDNTIDTDAAKALADESYSSLRPSIETSLHLVMPHKVVVHIHSINTIAYAIYKNFEQKFSALLKGYNIAFVKYARPGLPLTKEIEKTLHTKPDILILENHGIVIGADSAKDAEKLVHEIEEKIFLMDKGIIMPDIQYIKNLIQNSNYRLPKYNEIHNIASDEFNLGIAAKGALYPDHVVFLGSGIKLYNDSVNLTSASAPCYAISGKGMIVRNDLSIGAELMLVALSRVLNKIHSSEGLKYLTKDQEDELLNWDAEKYRQSLNK